MDRETRRWSEGLYLKRCVRRHIHLNVRFSFPEGAQSNRALSWGTSTAKRLTRAVVVRNMNRSSWSWDAEANAFTKQLRLGWAGKVRSKAVLYSETYVAVQAPSVMSTSPRSDLLVAALSGAAMRTSPTP